MSVFGAPFNIVLPAVGTSEVLGTLPVDTKAVLVVCTTDVTGAFQYPQMTAGFATAVGAQFMGGFLHADAPTSANQTTVALLSETLIGAGSIFATTNVAQVTVTTMAGTSLGLTKNGDTAGDVVCTVHPIVCSTTPDIRRLASLSGAGTTATITGLSFQPGAFLFISASSSVALNANTARLAFGMSAGAGNGWVTAQGSDYNVNPSNAKSWVRTNRFGLTMSNWGGFVGLNTGSISVGSVSATGYTLTQDGNMETRQFLVMAIPGEFALLQGAVPASTGLQSITGAGFAPSSLLTALAANPTSSGPEFARVGLSVGGGTLAAQRVSSYQNPDDTSTPRPRAMALGGSVLRGTDASGQTSLANIDSFDADGFTLNWTDADATAGLWAALVSEQAAPAGPSAAAKRQYRRNQLLEAL